jgi:D-alanine-D-alanine ligase
MGFTLEELKTKRIGVLLGGLSSERDISLKTGNAIVHALESRGYDVRAIDVGRDLAGRLAADPVDVAFIALHGRWGEDGSIQGLLETMFIPYTGSGVLASAAAMDKVFTKRVFMAEDIPVADHVAFDQDEPVSLAEVPFGLPCVVKPSREGSSVGVSVVKTEAEFAPAVEEARRHAGVVLVEKFVKGREVNVAVLFGQPLGAIEIRPSREFYDYTAKYTPGMTQYLYPAPLPPDVYEMVLQMGARAHKALGCDGATRADLIVTDGSMIVLEVNTLPGMTETSLLPKIAAGQGIDFPTLCERLLCGASLKA